MIVENIQTAIESLREQRGRVEAAIVALEAVLGKPAAAKAPARTARRRSRTKAKRAPRGLLRAKIHQVLKVAGRPLSMAQIRDRVLKAGYPASSAKNLYASVFIAVGRDPKVKKTKAGFKLK